VITIQRRNDRGTPINGLIFSLFFLGFVVWMLAPAFFRIRSFTELLYVLPVSGFFIAVGVGLFRSSLIRPSAWRELCSAMKRSFGPRRPYA
jgi:hypothetical protein